MNKVIEKINTSDWHDWILEKIDFENDSECINIALTIDYGVEVRFKFRDYIGFSFIGCWDEVTVEKMQINEKGDLIDSSKKVILDNNPNGFLYEEDKKRFNADWKQLDIKLLDGSFIKIVFREIEEEVIKK